MRVRTRLRGSGIAPGRDDGGWPVEWAEAVADDNLEIAAQLPLGAIIVRNVDEFFLRGKLFR